MWKIALVILLAFGLQGVLTMAQMKHFAAEFCKLKKDGRVACGRKAGGFRAGAIVMFQIDEEGIIRCGRKLEGITFLARVRPLNGLEGRHIATLTEDDGPQKGHRNLRKAIADAALTYRKFTAGEVIPEPPSPFQKVGNTVTGVFRRKQATM